MINLRPHVLLLSALLLLSCGGAETQVSTAAGPGALVVEYSSDSVAVFPPVTRDSILVFDWLRKVTDSADVSLDYTEYPFGILIVQIGPRRNGDGGDWLYKVNDAMVPKPCNEHRVAWSDTVKFFFNE